MEFKKILQTLKNTIKGFLALTLILSFSLNLAAAEKKKKKDPTFAIGIGMVAAAAGVVAFCALSSPSTSLNRQASQFGDISRAVARQNPPSAQNQQAPVQNVVALPPPQINMSCLNDRERSAFEVVALFQQLHRATELCPGFSARYQSVHHAHSASYQAQRQIAQAKLGSQTRFDSYLTEVANHQMLSRIGTHPAVRQSCGYNEILLARVAAVPRNDQQGLFQVAREELRVGSVTTLSPCGLSI